MLPNPGQCFIKNILEETASVDKNYYQGNDDNDENKYGEKNIAWRAWFFNDKTFPVFRNIPESGFCV